MSDLLQSEGKLIDARTVRFERLLPGPIERVWAYLTDSEKRAKWLAPGEMELREGAPIELRFNHADLTPHDEPTPEEYKKHDGSHVIYWYVLRFDPPKMLTVRWGDEPRDSQVIFELTPRGNDVLLTVTHRRLPDRDMLLSVSGGWHVHLDILADHLNGRTPELFWTKHARLKAVYAEKIPE